MATKTKLKAGQSWQRFCRIVVKVFYRRFEVSGLESLPDDRGLVLCANHVNALADPIIVQAATRTLIHPLARSGLFKKPLLKPFLRIMGAVPIFRPGDKSADVKKNKDSFVQCYKLLARHQTLIIFPEGQSHSDSRLHNLKSGAARLTLGALEANNQAPAVIPVGLNFSRKGNFRGDVLVNFGQAIDMNFEEGLTPRQTVRVINERITEGLKAVTINADSWGDVDFVRRLEQFFAMRQGKVRRSNLSQRFSALQRLIDGQNILRQHEPERFKAIVNKLSAYERLCRRFGVKDYHLTLNYRPGFVVYQGLRILLTLLIGIPIILFGVLNSGLPFVLTRHLAKRFAKGKDQYDTAKIVIGAGLFILFWGLQLAAVYYWLGLKWLLIYAVALFVSAAVTVKMRGQYAYTREDIRVFIMLTRKKDIKQYLLGKRREIEVTLARLVRVAKRLSNK